MNRSKVIVRTSIIGIVANVALSILKVVIGLITGSIAITMDAVNNISDAASSVITIIGTRLAGKEPDKKHPFGYGRVEYLSAMFIAFLVLYAGLTSLIESVQAIFEPQVPSYTVPVLFLVVIGVIVKLYWDAM